MMICILYHLACTLEIFKWSKKNEGKNACCLQSTEISAYN